MFEGKENSLFFFFNSSGRAQPFQMGNVAPPSEFTLLSKTEEKCPFEEHNSL